MSLIVSFSLFLFLLAVSECRISASNPKKPTDELLSYMQARGFMQIDEIIDEKTCLSYKFYITHDSTQICLRHRCSDNIIVSEFKCKNWSSIRKSIEKPKRLPSQLTRKVRNHISTSKNTKGKAEGDHKESLLEKYCVKSDTCITFSKIQNEKGRIECWRKNCKEESSTRISCKQFDEVKAPNKKVLYKKRRHHGKV